MKPWPYSINKEQARKLLEELLADPGPEVPLFDDKFYEDMLVRAKNRRRDERAKESKSDIWFSKELNELNAEILEIAASAEEMMHLIACVSSQSEGYSKCEDLMASHGESHSPRIDLTGLLRKQMSLQVQESVSLLQALQSRMAKYEEICQTREAEYRKKWSRGA